MSDAFLDHIRATLDDIEAQGLTKRERLLTGPQGGRIHVASQAGAREAVNLCANNYLGLADHPDVIAAARRAMDEFGFGMASVRFICGAQTLHRELEQAIAKHLGKDDAIAFAACFDANGGVFEPLLDEQDAIISDSLNHASIIDGVRLSKAKRYRFANSDMNELEDRLKEADSAGARFKLIATDGVFSMDGYVAKLKEICALADRYGALVLVDDCHATGHLGEKGRGTPALTGAGDRVDIVTGTFGKTLGGGMGGFVAAAQPIVDLLRQRARPYLFSNSLAPPIAAGALEGARDRDRRGRAARFIEEPRAALSRRRREGRVRRSRPERRRSFRSCWARRRRAQDLAKALDERGLFVAGFFFPVVPKGKARIRTQMSAALTEADIDFAIAAFAEAGKELGIV